MLVWGITYGNDLTQHFQFASEVYNSVSSGIIYPGFSADANDGLGDVGLRFYPPLTYYVLSALFFVFGDWHVAALACFLIIFTAGGIGIYLWAKTEFSTTQSLLAAAIFTFAPYHLSLIYNNFLLAEFAATAVFPFCFYFVARVCGESSFRAVLGLAVSYALLVLTHLPSAIIISVCLVLYSLLLLDRGRLMQTLLRLGIGGLAGLLASAFYWSRMVPELDWLKHSAEEYFTATFDYSANFLLHPRNIINFQNDTLNLWVADLMLVSTSLLIVPAVFLLLTKRIPSTKFTNAAVTIFAFCLFMVTPLSQPVWDGASFLQRVQFPWRFMGVLSAFGAMIASIGMHHLARQPKLDLVSSGAIGIILVLFVFVSTFLVKGAVYKPRSEFLQQTESLSTGDSYIGWWPVWAKRSGRSITDRVTANRRPVEIISWNRLERTFAIEPGETAIVQVRTYYYPHWQVIHNNVRMPAYPDDNGLLSFKIEPDGSQITLKFEEPLSVKLSYIISGLTWISFLAGFLQLARGANSGTRPCAVRN